MATARQAVAELMPSTPCLTKELTFTEITASDSDGDVVAHAVQTYRLGG